MIVRRDILSGFSSSETVTVWFYWLYVETITCTVLSTLVAVKTVTACLQWMQRQLMSSFGSCPLLGAVEKVNVRFLFEG